jgi:hypothetical protein
VYASRQAQALETSVLRLGRRDDARHGAREAWRRRGTRQRCSRAADESKIGLFVPGMRTAALEQRQAQEATERADIGGLRCWHAFRKLGSTDTPVIQ